MSPTAWRVTSHELTDAGRRYTVVLGQREFIVLHAGSGWQFWNGHARCEPNPGVRAAILDFEKDNPYDEKKPRSHWQTTMQDISDEALRTGFEGW